MGCRMAAALGVGLASGIVNFSQFLSPDILAAALQILVVHAYVRRRIAAQTLWSLALVTARPDFMLFPLALAAAYLACRLRWREGVGIPCQAAPALAALAGWGVLRASMDCPDWAAIVNFALYKDPRFVMALGVLCHAAWWGLVAGGRVLPPGRLPVAAAAFAAFGLGHVQLFPVMWDQSLPPPASSS
jgi:hypothetical protein